MMDILTGVPSFSLFLLQEGLHARMGHSGPHAHRGVLPTRRIHD